MCVLCPLPLQLVPRLSQRDSRTTLCPKPSWRLAQKDWLDLVAHMPRWPDGGIEHCFQGFHFKRQPMLEGSGGPILHGAAVARDLPDSTSFRIPIILAL